MVALLALLPALLATPMVAGAASEESILIFRPLEDNREIYFSNEDELLAVPGGRMFLFQVEISAFSPLLEVRVNGRVYAQPQSTWVLLKMPQYLRPGKNRIVVEARTGRELTTREFVVELKRLPGFNKP